MNAVWHGHPRAADVRAIVISQSERRIVVDLTKRAVLLQFHSDFELCGSRVRLLRTFNPGVPVFGLFGGDPAEFGTAERVLGAELDGLYRVRDRAPAWNKRHTDLAVRKWFIDVGHDSSFDVLHAVQWDLLLLDSLSRLYADVPPNSLALTGLTPLSAIADRWWWMLNEPHLSEWKALLDMVRKKFAYSGIPHACLGPGYALPRRFLDAYAAGDAPEIAHDELKLPLFAQIFGFGLSDTGFYPKWFDKETELMFHADTTELDLAPVRHEIARGSSRRAFHPCRGRFSEQEIEAMLAPLR